MSMSRGGAVLLAVAALAAATLSALAGSSPEQLQKDLGDEAIVGNWHYDDIPGGLAEAKKTGRPVLVIFR